MCRISENTSEQSEDLNLESRGEPVDRMIESPRPDVITIQDSPVEGDLNTSTGSPQYFPPPYSPYYPEIIDIVTP